MKDNITLKEGLNIFYKKNRKYFSEKKMSQKGETFIRCHDIAHVVFNCDTSIYGEGVVKIWTTFGTTMSFWEVTKGYRDVSAFELSRKYSFGHVVKNIFRLLVVIPKVIFRAKRMNKPWPFSNYDNYLNTPIAAIRKEYIIQVLK